MVSGRQTDAKALLSMNLRVPVCLSSHIRTVELTKGIQVEKD